jgi:ribosomal protein S18 acetylase RimI-like enzyme
LHRFVPEGEFMHLRIAQNGDLVALHELDAICFPAGDVDWEPAEPDELEEGVRKGTVLLAEDQDDGVLGYLHYAFLRPDHAYLNAVAVRPGARRRGVARLLIRNFFDIVRSVDPACSISAVAGLGNLPAAALLLSDGFVIRTLMRDYYGPGRDRLYFQVKVRIEFLDPDERFVVPLGARQHIERLLMDERYVITSLVRLPSDHAFEFSRFDREDFAALESNETAAGIQFSGVVLSAIAFVLGFSFASSKYPDAARVLLLGASLMTTLSLIIYANTSGETARLRSNSFSDHMKWGNVLSEFGGVFPFLISLPVTFAGVSRSRVAALIVSGLFAIGMIGYSMSRFSLSRRFAGSVWTRLATLITCTSAVWGTAVIDSAVAMWTWTAVVTATLTAQSAIYILKRPNERRQEARPAAWSTRG